MAEGAGVESLEGALDSAFALPEKEAPLAVEPLPDDVPEAQEGAEVEEIEAAPAPDDQDTGPEPEYEIEVDGERLTIRGEQSIRENLQKAVDYTKKSEANARVRDALVAQAQIQKQQHEFQMAVAGDIAELRAYDQQIEQFAQIDWATAFDTDPFNALKLKEQRDQLREKRGAKYNELERKHTQYQQGQAHAASQALAAEQAALFAKLPEWRNSEKAASEKQAIASALVNDYGFNRGEIDTIMDHRMLLVAKDAAAYRALQKGKQAHVKQVRDAPPVVKPGAAPHQDQGKAVFQKTRIELRKLGKQGNHSAQEKLAIQMLNRAFK